MKRDFSAYPRKWGRREPDPNIDHRRVPNLMTYFRREGAAKPLIIHNIGRGHGLWHHRRTSRAKVIRFSVLRRSGVNPATADPGAP